MSQLLAVSSACPHDAHKGWINFNFFLLPFFCSRWSSTWFYHTHSKWQGKNCWQPSVETFFFTFLLLLFSISLSRYENVQGKKGTDDSTTKWHTPYNMQGLADMINCLWKKTTMQFCYSTNFHHSIVLFCVSLFMHLNFHFEVFFSLFTENYSKKIVGKFFTKELGISLERFPFHSGWIPSNFFNWIFSERSFIYFYFAARIFQVFQYLHLHFSKRFFCVYISCAGFVVMMPKSCEKFTSHYGKLLHH